MIKEKFSLLSLALLSYVVLLLGLGLNFALELLSQPVAIIIALAVVYAELSIPLQLLRRFKLNPLDFNIYAFHIEGILDRLLGIKNKEKPLWSAIGHELWWSVRLCLVIFIPYIALYYGFYWLKAEYLSQRLLFSFNLPPRLWQEIASQLLVVALPEELYYRGFLQGVFLKKWPARFFVVGLPLGRAIILTNILFATAHLMNGFSPFRLLTFFPGLVFSWIVFKRKNLLSAIIFHAACNLLGQILYHSFFLRP